MLQQQQDLAVREDKKLHRDKHTTKPYNTEAQEDCGVEEPTTGQIGNQ